MTGSVPPAAQLQSSSAAPPQQRHATFGESLHVARQLERAQAGAHADVLQQTERELRLATGDLADGPAGLHFVRAVSLVRCGRPDDALTACDLMLAAAMREGEHGWLSCAYSMHAIQLIELEAREPGRHDPEAGLRGLVAADVALDLAGDDAVQRCNAHANLGAGYEILRLYELAGPHYEAAHTESLRVPDGGANPVLWSANLAMLHLQWALELYRVGMVEEAERHSARAAEAAEVAVSEAREWGDEHRVAMMQLHRDCALADGPEVEGLADRLLSTAAYLRSIDAVELALFAAPFLAVALNRVGRRTEATEYIAEAWEQTRPYGNVLSDAALAHTQAVLLEQSGSAEASIALQYGNILAQMLWRDRLRTLHAARTLREYELLRTAHEEASLSASTDALTGLVNRRALDALVNTLESATPPHPRVAVLVIDLDHFKEINDTRGHDAGDETLRHVAGALAGSVRSGDTVARLGGDEFAVVLPGASEESALAVAGRALLAVEALQTLTSLSIGVAVRPAADARAALTAADGAMYVAKRAGGGRVHLAD